MAKYYRNDGGSVVVERALGRNNLIWSSFSTAAFRHKIIDTMRCGGSCHRNDVEPAEKREQQRKTECTSRSKRNYGSERLSELLKLSESSEMEEDVKKKVETLEVLKKSGEDVVV